MKLGLASRTALVLATLSFLALGAWAGWQALKSHRWNQGVDRLATALSRRELTQAAFLLRALEAQRPQHPDLVPHRARFLGLIQSPHAPVVWDQAVRLFPAEEEFRVAATLAHLQSGDAPGAARMLESWPQPPRSPTAFARAALAAAFARGDWAEAETHALALNRAAPDDPAAALNLARVQIQGPNAPEARQTLRRLAQSPAIRPEALRTLFQDALTRKQPGEVQQLAGFARTLQPALADAQWALLEALERAGLPTPESEIQSAWRLAQDQPAIQAQIAGWLTSRQLGTLAWTLFQNDPPPQPWNFPLGLALAEAALGARQESTAWAALARAEWPGLDDLRQLCLARLKWGQPGADTHLNRAVQDATRRPGGLVHLLQTVETWRWEPGLVAVLQARILTPDPAPREWAVLFSLLEKRADTEAMRQASLRFLELHPENPIALNNAAYFSWLRASQLDQAEAWAAKAHQTLPESRQIASTLALILLSQNKSGQAEALLGPIPPGPDTILAHASLLKIQHKSLNNNILQILRTAQVTYPEEVAQRDTLLGSNSP